MKLRFTWLNYIEAELHESTLPTGRWEREANLYADFELKLAVLKEDILKEMEDIRMSLSEFAPVAA